MTACFLSSLTTATWILGLEFLIEKSHGAPFNWGSYSIRKGYPGALVNDLGDSRTRCPSCVRNVLEANTSRGSRTSRSCGKGSSRVLG